MDNLAVRFDAALPNEPERPAPTADFGPPPGFDQAAAGVIPLERGGDIADWLSQAVKIRPDQLREITVHAPGPAGSIVAETWVCGWPPDDASKFADGMPQDKHGNLEYDNGIQTAGLYARLATEASGDSAFESDLYYDTPYVDQLAAQLQHGPVLTYVSDDDSKARTMTPDVYYFEGADDWGVRVVNGAGERSTIAPETFAADIEERYIAIRPADTAT